ncbi:MAG: hypothetical protein HC850_05485 [Rhodomicrobium sp.]|nr:hypothetical protein [Rhodomicrobium sp.]
MSINRENKRDDRQIVGFSLPRELAARVKSEAGRRNLSLRNLFIELWALYEEKQKRGGRDTR